MEWWWPVCVEPCQRWAFGQWVLGRAVRGGPWTALLEWAMMRPRVAYPSSPQAMCSHGNRNSTNRSIICSTIVRNKRGRKNICHILWMLNPANDSTPPLAITTGGRKDKSTAANSVTGSQKDDSPKRKIDPIPPQRGLRQCTSIPEHITQHHQGKRHIHSRKSNTK